MNDINYNFEDDFPGLLTEFDGTKVTYLDNAATSLKPRSMVEAMSEYYLGVSSNVHRGKSYALEQVSNRYEEARYKVAELLSCSGNEVIFLRNTTECINLVASGLALDEKDLVIVFSDSHHSNFLPWMKHGNIKIVSSNSDGSLNLEHYYELLKLNPKVVAITHCSNVTGVYSPLKEMAAAAKNSGAIVVVDAAQSIPHRKINLKDIQVDFLAFSAHKMLGPTGVGILFGRQQLLEKINPMNLGGGMVDWVDVQSYQLRKIPHRFEAGTPHIAGAYGMAAAIDYINKIGYDVFQEHDRMLGHYMLESSKERPYLEVINSNELNDRGAVLSFKIPSASQLDDVARVLSDSYGIICRNGHLCAQPYVTEQASGQVLRISAYIYSQKKDIDKFFKALDEISKVMFY